MILTIPVIAYQLFFVVLHYIASRVGNKTLTACTALCLLWTVTHIILLPLAILQTIVILVSHVVFRRKTKARAQPSA